MCHCQTKLVALPVVVTGGEQDVLDPDLAIVVEAWPTLSAAIKVGIFAMVQASWSPVSRISSRTS